MKSNKSRQSKLTNSQSSLSEVELKNGKSWNYSAKVWRYIFIALAAVSLVVMIVLSLGAGNSGDEHFHLEQAEHVYNYYTTFGKDSTAATITEKYNLPYYGQSVDNFAYFVTEILGIEDIYKARHVINSIFGWLAMLFAGLIAYRIAGWRAAVIAFALIFLSPRFLGHSFNNLKDLPTATSMAVGLYCLVRFLQEFPKIKWKTAIFFALSIGFAISVRVSGLLLIAYFGMFGAIYYFIRNYKQGLFSKNGKHEFWLMIKWGLGISLIGFFFGVLLWPFAIQAPISNVSEALAGMSKFAISIRQVFEGSFQWSNTLPWYYTPKFIMMTIPIAVIIGALLYLVLLWKKKENYFWSFFVFFTFFFPVFWIVYQNSNVYGGWRHAMFIYPALVVFAALGFESLIEIVKNKYAKMAIVASPFLLLIFPFVHIIKNHPYEYVYFNELSGGMKNAYGNYELDYYYHSTREASEWIIAHAQKSGLETGDKIRVATWHPASVNYYFRNDTADFKVVFSRWYERGNNDWDYAIFVVTGIMPEQIKGEYFPPKNTVHTINVDGKPICLILKRDNKADYEASLLRAKINEPDLNQEEKYHYLQQSINKYKEALVYDSGNEIALSSIVELYMSINLDSAIFYTNKLIEICPIESYLGFASNMYMSAYERTKNQQYITMALNASERIVKNNPYSATSQYDLAILYAKVGNVGKGKNIMEEYWKNNKRNFQANYYTAIYYAQTGNSKKAIELLENCMEKFPEHEQECQGVINQIRGR